MVIGGVRGKVYTRCSLFAEVGTLDKSSTGLEPNVAGLLCYVLGWITGLVFLLIERDSKFVKFHAWQSIYVFGALTIIGLILGWIPVIGLVLGWIVSVLAFILWIVLMVRAYQGATYKVRWLGDMAEKRVE